MVTRRDFIKKSGLAIAAAAMSGSPLKAMMGNNGQGSGASAAADGYVCQRPKPEERHFTSKAVEEVIAGTKKKLKDPKLAWMFENCFPNTLDTTVNFKMIDGKPDTFVITGDIDAMWLRDSGAQVWPYVALCKKDEQLRLLIAGVINRQTKLIQIDRYANGFTHGAESSEWATDLTEMKPYVHERKWEIDSLCYPIRLAYQYWKVTGDTSVFDQEWKKSMALMLQTFKEQQRKDGHGPYKFQRKTERQLDTLNNDGWGNPVNPVGLIVSSFRPSDDATTFGFLIPSNMFAVASLKQLAEISNKVSGDSTFASQCMALADEVQAAIHKYAIVNHPKYGKVYPFEIDGFGNNYFMDDANVHSLLAMPYLKTISAKDPVYRNTRKLVWSQDNPFFFKGKAGEGIGGPHIGYDMIWPMSIIMRAFTADNDGEIRQCIRMLRDTDGGTGFMHESFHKDNPTKFTRHWFAWTNTLFGELIVNLVENKKISLLNNL